MQNTKKVLSLPVINEYLEQLCEKHGLSDKVKNGLYQQVRKLKEFYGEEVPKEDFLQLIGKYLETLKTGYYKKPVDIEEFLLSSEYLNLSNVIRSPIKNFLIDLFESNDHCYEVLLAGAIRTGKTFSACAAMAYHIYRLSCLYNPQTHYELSPGSEIIFIFQSVNEFKARRNFRELHGMITNSNYFTNYFPPQTKSKNYLVFPNSVQVKPVASNNTAVMSENVFAGFLDEINFMKIIKGSANQGLDEGYYDQASRLYQTIRERIEYQFGNIQTKEWPGKLYLGSSANYKGDFVDAKKEEAKEKGHIYVFNKALWEVKDMDKLSGEKFWVKMPDEKQSGKILTEKPEPFTEDYIEVPIEFKKNFEEDLHTAIRNIAGKPIERVSKFIPSDSVLKGIEKYKQYYEGRQIFTVQEININEVFDLESLLDKDFAQAISPFGTFTAHLDMALSEDSAGLAIGFPSGTKTIDSKLVYDEQSQDYVEKDPQLVPIYSIVGLLRIVPPENGQIDIETVQKLLLLLKRHLPNLNSFRADRAYSASLLQTMRKNGINANILSVDTSSEPYFETKNSFTEGRVWLPEHHTFKEEIKGLYLDAVKGKVEHNRMTSKDVADSVTGSVYRMSKLRRSWKLKDSPLTLREMKDMQTEKEKESAKGGRGSRPRPQRGKRPRSNNRRNK